MKQLRLTRIQLAGAGLALAVGIIAVFFFMFIKPVRAATAKTNADAETTEGQVSTERPKAEAGLKAAQVEEVRVHKDYDEIMKKRMPDLSFEDRLASMIRLQRLQDEELAVIADWFDSTGAEVSGYSFPQFGTDLPDQTRRMLSPLTWNLSVTVPGGLPGFMKWLETFPKAPRFLVLNSVNLPGMRQPGTPFTAAVSVTLYEWLKVPSGAAAAATSAAPAAGAAQGSGPGGGPAGRGRGRRGGRGAGGG